MYSYNALPTQGLRLSGHENLVEYFADFDAKGLASVCRTWRNWVAWCETNILSAKCFSTPITVAFLKYHKSGGATAARGV